MATWIGSPISKTGSSSNRPDESQSAQYCTYSYSTTPYMFYSNNPETISDDDTADRGKFLNQGTVSGACQLYAWHQNGTSAAVTAVIQVYNPNSYKIKVEATHYGTTINKDTDSAAWYNYYRKQNKSITVDGGKYGYLFTQSVPKGQNWGFVARLSITNFNTGANASAGLTDFVYKSSANASNAIARSGLDGSDTRVRGVGRGYYTYVNFATLDIPAGTFGAARRIGGYDSVFGGNELIEVIGPGNSGSGEILGGFGQQFEVTIRVKNRTNINDATFDIFVGSNGGKYFPFVNFENNYYYPASGLNSRGYEYVGILRTEPLLKNALAQPVTFSMTVPAGSNAPILIGARMT